MNILFIHKDFPGPFGNLATELANDPNNKVFFITCQHSGQIDGINKMIYELKKSVPQDCHDYLVEHEEALIHAQAVADIARAFKIKEFKFDVIYTQAFGPGLFIKYIFGDTPVILYGDWYNRVSGVDIGFDGNVPDINYQAEVRCSNSCMLIDLYSCQGCVVRSEWQKRQFPKGFYDKIKVIPEEIDTDFFKPADNVEFLGLTAKDEVITYASRGLEPYHGFGQFMEAVSILLKKRPNAHIIIAGKDKVFCRPELFDEKYKETVLGKFELDMNRVHFTGFLPRDEYLKLLQISSVHVHLTYPYIPSKTLLEAMSAGCCIVASNTPPVLEIVKDNCNGILTDFFNVGQIAEKIEYALENKEKTQDLRTNARKTVIENYSVSKTLPFHVEYVKSVKCEK
ncbi:MAG: glycosyltransferase [Candidatus Gastranaerophilales bacterium]|nr:glycosyltransferase [Candidatus Gastranaerophilales bacterium]